MRKHVKPCIAVLPRESTTFTVPPCFIDALVRQKVFARKVDEVRVLLRRVLGSDGRPGSMGKRHLVVAVDAMDAKAVCDLLDAPETSAVLRIKVPALHHVV